MDVLTAVNISASNNIKLQGNISGSVTSTGSFGSLMIDGGHFTSASLAAGGSGVSSYDDLTNVPSGIFSSSLQTFTNITASGDISASGDVFTNQLSILGNTAVGYHGPSNSLLFSGTGLKTGIKGSEISFTSTEGAAPISTVGHITSSGNISASSTSTGSFGTIETTGNISASGIIHAHTFTSKGIGIATHLSGTDFLGNSSTKTHIQGTNIELGAPVTASGDISASGNLNSNKLLLNNTDGNDNLEGTSEGVTYKSNNHKFIGHITASGNISASGTLDITGDVNFDGGLDVDGTTNLDTTNIDGDLNVSSNIIHTGDTNTKIVFSTDKITFTVGGADLLTLEEASTDVAIFSHNISASNTSGVHTFGGNSTFNNTIVVGDVINNAGGTTTTGHLLVNMTELTGSIFGGGNTLSGDFAPFLFNYGDGNSFSGSLTNAGFGYGDVFSHQLIHSSVNAGDICYYTLSAWRPAQATNVGTGGQNLIGVALADGANIPGPVLIRGMVRLGSGHIVDSSGINGDALFLDDINAGHVRFEAPDSNGDIVRIVGYCIDESNDIIYFDPSKTFVEVST